MATDYWREDTPRQPTRFEDLQAGIACSTRVAIVVTLSHGPCDVSHLKQILGFSMPLLSNHLKVLRESRLVEYDREGGRHVYRLAGSLTVRLDPSLITLSLRADDKSTLVANIPMTAPITRILACALADNRLPPASQ